MSCELCVLGKEKSFFSSQFLDEVVLFCCFQLTYSKHFVKRHILTNNRVCHEKLQMITDNNVVSRQNLCETCVSINYFTKESLKNNVMDSLNGVVYTKYNTMSFHKDIKIKKNERL
jgi:hypothetical protein